MFLGYTKRILGLRVFFSSFAGENERRGTEERALTTGLWILDNCYLNIVK
jgi:hypothetical protein